jgi:hypothetical protein
MPGAIPKLELAIQFAVKAELPGRAEFRRWARSALRTDVSAALRVVDAEEGIALNRDYRGKDSATNVLTFEYGPDPDSGALTGDIVLCAPVVERRRRNRARPWPPTTPTSPCTACCTSRATTTKPGRRMRTPWRPWKALSCRPWVFPIHISKL